MAQLKPDNASLQYRLTILEILQKARRGHVGSAFSLVEIIRVLFDDILRYDAKNPKWEDRDRFILSKGHGCLALYVALAEKGFFPKEELFRFCSMDGILGGHPEYVTTPGVEASTGSLGHGLSIGVGMALAAKIDRKTYRTFVVLGDGECDEGSVWEAALSASKHRLNSLTALIDYNKMQCYSSTSEVLELEPLADKWKSFGFAVKEVDGHDANALRKILHEVSFHPSTPGLLICHTVKGKGVPAIENNPLWHHKSKITEEELKPFFEYLRKQMSPQT
jgi:transketolase